MEVRAEVERYYENHAEFSRQVDWFEPGCGKRWFPGDRDRCESGETVDNGADRRVQVPAPPGVSASVIAT